MTLKAFGLLAFFTLPVVFAVSAEETDQRLARGEYVFNMGGCASCHSVEDGEPLTGGLPMETPFGTFYTPNITADKATGIGGWSDEDFIRAMTQGLAPDNSHYYPAFPYTSYAKMSSEDLLDLKLYLDKQPSFTQQNKTHDVGFPFNIRPLLGLWKWVNFDDQSFEVDNTQSTSWNRGAYIVNGPGHCVECHSPRNLTGGIQSSGALSGNPDGLDGETMPGLTMDEQNRISQWSDEDLVFSLQLGMIPDGDFLGGSMGHVIENTTSKLSEADLKAIVDYLKSFKQ